MWTILLQCVKRELSADCPPSPLPPPPPPLPPLPPYHHLPPPPPGNGRPCASCHAMQSNQLALYQDAPKNHLYAEVGTVEKISNLQVFTFKKVGKWIFCWTFRNPFLLLYLKEHLPERKFETKIFHNFIFYIQNGQTWFWPGQRKNNFFGVSLHLFQVKP